MNSNYPAGPPMNQSPRAPMMSGGGPVPQGSMPPPQQGQMRAMMGPPQSHQRPMFVPSQGGPGGFPPSVGTPQRYPPMPGKTDSC